MIKLLGAKFKSFKFPCGEINVKVTNPDQNTISIRYIFDGSDSIIELMLIVDAIKQNNMSLGHLIMDYVPFSRQDRVMNQGESLSLKVFCDLINSMEFKTVYIQDAHSCVTTALLNNCREFHQHEMFEAHLTEIEDFYLISPDGGALKKIYELAKLIHPIAVIECTKERDVKTGDIKRTIVHHHRGLEGKDCVIVDDICDGGRTFIEIAKVLKSKDCGEITLCVTHGFFTKGIEVFDGLIDRIITNKGVVK